MPSIGKAGIIAAVTAMLAGGAQCDVVWVGQLEYRNAMVLGATPEAVTFLLGGKALTKALGEVTKLKVDNWAGLNQAEEHFASGQYDKAIAAYKAAEASAGEDWQKVLVKTRLQMAERRKALPAPAPSPTATTQSADKKPCYGCRDSGLMPCTECLFNGRVTGRGVCPLCNDKGRVVCPDCGGDSWKKKCANCGGGGKVAVGTRQVGMFIQKVFARCYGCDGTGYADPCATCGRESLSNRGSLTCSRCAGTGFYGPCPACRGTKRTPCTHCDEGKKHASVTERILSVDEKAGALASPDAFFATAPKAPETSASMTELQREQVNKQYEEDRLRWLNQFKGKDVTWRLTVDQVNKDSVRSPFKSSTYVDAITLRASAANGSQVVEVHFPPGMAERLSAFARRQEVLVKAKILVYESDALRMEGNDITLAPKAPTETAKTPDPPTPMPTTHPAAPPKPVERDPLASADALMATMPKGPKTAIMTDLEARQAITEYLEKVGDWDRRFRGEQVAWPVKVTNVDALSTGVILWGESAGGTAVTVFYPRSKIDDLSKVSKGQNVVIKGTILSTPTPKLADVKAHLRPEIEETELAVKGTDISPSP